MGSNQLGEIIKQGTVRVELLCRFKLMLSPLTSNSRLPFFFSSHSEGDKPKSGGFPYKCKCLLQKGQLLHCSHSFSCVRFFLSFFFCLNNQLKIILEPKRHVLGWHILLSLLDTIMGNSTCTILLN